VPTILVLSGIIVSVVAHEGGHLLATRCLGVKVTEFFVGFGPKLWSRRTGEVTWGVKLLPLGGYVRIVGMTAKESVAPEDESRTFRAAAPWRRGVIALAGPAVNLALAIGLLFGHSLGNESSPRAAAGDARATLVTTVEVSTRSLVGLPAGVPGMVRAAVDPSVADPTNRVLSPVGATRLAGQAARDGIATALGLLAIINVFLALFNLVPLPPLDGGHIALAGFDGLASRVMRRRVRVDPGRFTPLTLAVVGMVAVMGLASIVLDITRPFANPFT
jgi:membrane-associated protease RseP (regulator of RpoE activity)